MQYDHLSSAQFWDFVYTTAKNKKKKKQIWLSLFTEDYADIVRDLADSHIHRMQKNLENNPTNSESIRKAKSFIEDIRGTAIHHIERHTAEGRSVRKYARIADLHEYTVYLKDTLDDLRALVPQEKLTDFDFYASLEEMKNDNSVEFDVWLSKRRERTT